MYDPSMYSWHLTRTVRKPQHYVSFSKQMTALRGTDGGKYTQAKFLNYFALFLIKKS